MHLALTDFTSFFMKNKHFGQSLHGECILQVIPTSVTRAPDNLEKRASTANEIGAQSATGACFLPVLFLMPN